MPTKKISSKSTQKEVSKAPSRTTSTKKTSTSARKTTRAKAEKTSSAAKQTPQKNTVPGMMGVAPYALKNKELWSLCPTKFMSDSYYEKIPKKIFSVTILFFLFGSCLFGWKASFS